MLWPPNGSGVLGRPIELRRRSPYVMLIALYHLDRYAECAWGVCRLDDSPYPQLSLLLATMIRPPNQIRAHVAQSRESLEFRTTASPVAIRNLISSRLFYNRYLLREWGYSRNFCNISIAAQLFYPTFRLCKYVRCYIQNIFGTGGIINRNPSGQRFYVFCDRRGWAAGRGGFLLTNQQNSGVAL